jgi:fructosamine-3-kinase
MITELTQARLADINVQSTDRSEMFYWQTDRPMTMEECAIIFGQRGKSVTDEALAQDLENALAETSEYEGAKVLEVSGGDQYTIGSVNINRGFKLSTGAEVVGRFHPKGLRNGYFGVEVEVAKLALAHGIKAAKPVLVHAAESANELDFVVFEKASGKNMKHYIMEHPDDEPMLLHAVGAEMAKLHEVKVEGFGFFDNELALREGKLRGIHNSYHEHVLAALGSNLKTIVSAGLIDQIKADKIQKILENTKLTEESDARLVHNDMADWNVIVNSNGVDALIDWDEAHAGDPITDIACWSLFFPYARLEKLLEGYKSVRSLPEDFEERLHIYRLRYLVSKLALRHKKYVYDRGENMMSLISAGLEALQKESEYFNL